MDSSSDEGLVEASAGNDAKPGKPRRKLTFGKEIFTKRTRSSTIYSPPATPSPQNGTDRNLERGSLIRSRSEDVGPNVKAAWAQEIWGQQSLRESAMALRNSVEDYEREATQQQWKDLLKINADLTELGKLVDDSKKNKSKGTGDDEGLDGLSKFSTVALEYSKMLDVIMNQAPEYAGLAWGAIRLLLVAHTNHSKLKYAVESYLIQFGQEFGLVNSLMNSHPTQKMVEAVSEAYTAFSKFLAKAVKYYKESKLQSAVRAFAFPWETRFQLLVNRIEAAFKRIKEIASAGHLGVTVQTQNMISTIGAKQEHFHHEMRQNTLDLRQALKLEMKEEVQALFDSFDRNWISRFEQIMIQSTQAQPALPSTQGKEALPAPPYLAAIDYTESMSESAPRPGTGRPATYLADSVTKAKRLKRFRDKCFSLLQETDNDEETLNARIKHLTSRDLQQIMGLLRNDSTRDWLQASLSTFLWVNTFKQSGLADWTTAFAARIIEFAGRIENMTVLYHFCGNHGTAKPVSTAAVLLQSLIIQIIQLHHKGFFRKEFPFTLEHFQDAQEDIEDLWGLFHSCCSEAQLPCVWIVIDNIDHLQKGEDYDSLLVGLHNLAFEDSLVFKVFASTRKSGTPSLIAEAIKDDPSSTRFASITVPRAQSSMSSALFSKRRRSTRLPDVSPDISPYTTDAKVSKPDIQGLLDSSEDELKSEKEQEDPDLVESPTSLSSPKNSQIASRSGVDTDLSDSSLEFMKDDPFASTEESDMEKASNSRIDDSEDEDLSFTRKVSKEKDSILLTSSSDDESSSSILLQSPKMKRGSGSRSKPGSRSIKKQKSALDSSTDSDSDSAS